MSTSTVGRQTSHPDKSLQYALFAAQGLLGVLYAVGGALMISVPIAALTERLAWVAAIPPWLVRLIGLSELLGAVSLLLPGLTRVLPRITGLGASGLVALMSLAAVFHLARGEYVAVVGTLLLAGAAFFVAWSRLVELPRQQ